MDKTDYDEIYLTDELGEVTWCEDRIMDEDVKYVNASKRLEFGSEEAQKYIVYGRETAGKEVAAVYLVNFFDCVGIDAANISGKSAAEMIIERLDSDLFDIFGDTDAQFEWRDGFFDAFKARMERPNSE